MRLHSCFYTRRRTHVHTHAERLSHSLACSCSAFHTFEPIRMHYAENKEQLLGMMLISQLHNAEYERGENLLDLMNVTHRYALRNTSVGSYAHGVRLRSVMSLSVNL